MERNSVNMPSVQATPLEISRQFLDDLVHADVRVQPDDIRHLFDDPERTKSALLAIWTAEEQGGSDWIEGLLVLPTKNGRWVN
jgi:hypothetical protein